MKWQERGTEYMTNNRIKAYRDYTFSTNKRLHVFVWAALFIIIIMPRLSFGINSHSAGMILAISGCALAFITPFYCFRHLFWKRSSELYFSLPITRKEMFKETFLSILKTYLIPLIIIFIVNIGFSMIINKPEFNNDIKLLFPLESLGYLALSIPIFIAISAMVTWVISFTNNLIDAILISLACMLVPMLLYSAFSTFISKQVSEVLVGAMGDSGEFLTIRNIPAFMSPFYCLMIFAEHILLPRGGYYQDFHWFVPIAAYLFWILIGIAALGYANRMYQRRKQESSEERTMDWYGYPLWIHITTVSLILLNLNSNRIKSSLFAILFILISYIGMMFVAQRKIRLRAKHFVGFASVVIAVLLFSYLFEGTNGFGRLNEVVATDSVPYIEISMQSNDFVSTDGNPKNLDLDIVTAIDNAGEEVITQTSVLQIETSNHDIMKEIEKLQEASADKAFRDNQFEWTDFNEIDKGREVMIMISYYEGKDRMSNIYKWRQYFITNEDLNQIYQEFVLRISKDKPKDTNVTTVTKY